MDAAMNAEAFSVSALGPVQSPLVEREPSRSILRIRTKKRTELSRRMANKPMAYPRLKAGGAGMRPGSSARVRKVFILIAQSETMGTSLRLACRKKPPVLPPFLEMFQKATRSLILCASRESRPLLGRFRGASPREL